MTYPPNILALAMSDSKSPCQGNSDPAEARRARISSYDGKKIGVCIVLSSSQLRRLGISLSDTEVVEYQIVPERERPVLEVCEVQETTESV